MLGDIWRLWRKMRKSTMSSSSAMRSNNKLEQPSNGTQGAASGSLNSEGTPALGENEVGADDKLGSHPWNQ